MWLCCGRKVLLHPPHNKIVQRVFRKAAAHWRHGYLRSAEIETVCFFIFLFIYFFNFVSLSAESQVNTGIYSVLFSYCLF